MAILESTVADFGLRPEACFGLELIPHSHARAPAEVDLGEIRRTGWQLVASDSLERAWPAREAQRLVEFRFLDGRSMMTVDYEPLRGYRVWAPGFGSHVVSPHGKLIRSALPGYPGRRWQRLFCAQVLPLAATLQGLELFHASAVLVDGRVVAFGAPSGTGKSSIAAHLVAGGGELVTDDVLAMEARGDTVVAHRGPGFLNLDTAELRGLSRGERARLGLRIGGGPKMWLAPVTVDRPLPLAAICFLERRRASALELVEDEPPRPGALLAGSAIPYVRSAARLTTHLEMCARIAASCRTFQVVLPEGTPARDSARVLRTRLARALEADS
jgi:hypothetical protein